MTGKLDTLPVILDRAVTREGDRFGHQDFADALNLLIRDPHNTPPFSIGLLGQWGTGKSSIEEMSIEDLQVRKDSRGKLQEDHRFKIIRFNAWRYGGENLKRALLREVFLGLSPSREEGEHRLREAIKTEYTFAGVTNSDPWADLWPVAKRAGVLLLFVAGFTAVIAAVWAFILWYNDQTGVAWLQHFVTSFTQVPALSLLGLGAFGLALFTQLRFMLPPYRTMSEKRSAKSIEETIESSLEELIQQHLADREQRVVVFVDDLDRLSADEMVSSLDAIRNFMDIKVHQRNAPPGRRDQGLFSGLVFVISCDEKRIAEALEKRRHKASDLPAVVLNAQDARRFLDRVFQYRLEIPPFPKQDMRAFIREKFDVPKKDGGLLDLKGSLEAFELEPQYVVERLIQYDVTNPRAALQVVNSFAQSWWVAVRREAIDKGQRIGALTQGVVTRHAEVLAVLSALRVLHPTFHQELQQTPQLLRNFIDVLVDQDPGSAAANYKRLPPKDRRMLQTYLKKIPEAEDKSAIEIDEKFLPLLDSIAWRNAGLHLPDDLEPLLLLSQDIDERRSSRPIRELEKSLATRAGFLAALGVQGDARLTGGDLNRVRQLIEERISHHEMGVVARQRAYETLTSPQFLERLPTDSANLHLVSNPLAQGLSGQRDLRHYVGPSATVEIARLATNNYQRDLLGVLADELLTEGTPLTFLDPATHQPISEETALESLKVLVPLLMAGNISEANQQRLEDWLERLNVGDGEIPVDTGLLRGWHQARPSFFQGRTGRAYARHVTQALLEGVLEGEDVLTEALAELEEVWQAELSRGEHREAVVEQLGELLARGDTQVATAAFEVWQRLRHLLRPSERRELVQMLGAYVVRVAHRNSDAVSEQRLRAAFVNQLEAEDTYTGENAGEVSSSSVINALKTWPTAPASAPDLARLANYSLARRPMELKNAVMTWMLDEERSELIPEAFGFIGEHLNELGDEVSTQAATLVKNDLAEPSDDLSQVEALLTAAGEQGVKAHFSKEAETVLPSIRSSYAGPRGQGAHQPYVVIRLMPAIMALAPAAPVEANEVLTRIATGFDSTPEVLSALMVSADGRWFSGMNVNTVRIIMDRSIQRMLGVPATINALTDPLIRLARTLIGAQDQQEARIKLGELGVQLWPSTKGAALKLLRAAESQVTPAQMAGLVTGVDIDDEPQRQQLADAWKVLLQRRPSEDRAGVLKALFTQRPKADEHLQEFIGELLGDSADAASLAQALLSETGAADFSDLWMVVLRKPGNIAPEWIADQAVRLLCDGQGVSTLEKHQNEMLRVLDTTAKQRMVDELKRRAFDGQVPQPAAELAASWMHRIDPQSLKRLKSFPSLVQDRVKQIRAKLQEG